MRYNQFRDPSRAAADGGLFDTELVLKPPPYTPEPVVEDDDEHEVLRLAPLRELDEAPPAIKRRRGPSRRVLVLSGWALALTVALSVGYLVQTVRQPVGEADAPPTVAPSPDTVGAPVTAPSIASEPDRFAQAEAAPQVSPPAPEGDVQVAEAAAPAAPLEPPPTAAAAPALAEPVKTQKVAQTAEAAQQDADADAAPAPFKAKAAEKPKPAKLETAKADDKAALAPKTLTDKAKAAKLAETKDLPQLKARMSRAYAQALKAGTPKAVLKARQSEWTVLYAKAEKKGPAAVAALYRARAAQLEAIAKKTAARSHGRA